MYTISLNASNFKQFIVSSKTTEKFLFEVLLIFLDLQGLLNLLKVYLEIEWIFLSGCFIL